MLEGHPKQANEKEKLSDRKLFDLKEADRTEGHS
jgi:hypothetical protein